MFIDMHVHSRISPCSNLSLDEILENAGSRGLDGVCITDHHSVEARQRIREGVQDDGLRVFVGMEYHTADGDFLLYGAPDDLPLGLDARILLRVVAREGGAAVAAHPFRLVCSVSESVIRDNLCYIVESVNGRNSDGENQQIDLWRRRYDLVECAGSDAHTLPELGKHKTRFHRPVNNMTDLVHALKNGFCAPHLNGKQV
jgi:predicted metal-dependent phosphoesterase TrpH